MEPVSLAIGVPGFIAVALQTVRFVVRSINSYRNLPREVESILNYINFELALFAGYVDLLLPNYMAERDSTELVQTQGSAPKYSQFHAQIRSWEDRFLELKRELTKQPKVQDQDGTEVDVNPDEFRTMLLEMELIKEVGTTPEAIEEIGKKYLKRRKNEVAEASEPRGGHMGALSLVKRRLYSAVCLAQRTCCAERHTDRVF